jgi:hypothetical protein
LQEARLQGAVARVVAEQVLSHADGLLGSEPVRDLHFERGHGRIVRQRRSASKRVHTALMSNVDRQRDSAGEGDYVENRTPGRDLVDGARPLTAATGLAPRTVPVRRRDAARR